ncbi:DUF1128 domain-containing protein [Melghirimyces algeriensis]|uniref:Uncharacterized protein YfkK, UPF0435 family n=1 Tax=Melghirimyces algeriensis TaxID=910412 RepID=A0A521DPK7_9BACL|nr:DUF1128 family protein [Melghirimyces algeriensis]SMO73031.1 Uncharacterized protein YfkK, UPF0435 family [Melghirimyces algeriensis]
MNLNEPTRENLNFLLQEIKNRLNLVNASAIQPEDYSLEDYDEVRDLYEMMKKKQGKLTMMELEGILEELGELRKR